MTTLTGQSASIAGFRPAGQSWGEKHPVLATVSIVAATIACALVLALLLGAFSQGPATAVVHHGGAAHARAAQLARVQRALAAEDATAARQAEAAAQGTPVRQSDSTAVKRTRVRQNLARLPVAVAVARGPARPYRS
jgi:hypothetical protein